VSYLISFTVQLHRRLGSKFVRSLGINPGGETWFTSGFICPLFHPHGLRQRQHCLGSSSPPSRVASPRQVGRGRAPQEAAHRPRREGRREPCWALSPPHPSGRPMANRAPPAGAILAGGAGRSATPPPGRYVVVLLYFEHTTMDRLLWRGGIGAYSIEKNNFISFDSNISR